MNSDFEKKLEHLKQGMIKIKTKYKIPDLINANQNSRRLSLIDLHKKYIEEKKEKDRIEEEKKKKKDLKKPSPKKYGSADIINQVIDQNYYEKVKQKEKEERLEKEKIEKLEKDRIDKDKVKLEDEKISELKIKENEVSKIDIVKSKLESSAMEIDEEYNEQFIDFPKIETTIKPAEVIKYDTKNENKNDKYIKIKKVETDEIPLNQNFIFTKKKSEPKESHKEVQIQNVKEIHKESTDKENTIKEKIKNLKDQNLKEHKEKLKDLAKDFTKKDKIELSKDKECEKKNVEMSKSKERPENSKDLIREKNGVNAKETSLKIEKAIQNQKEHSKSIISNINREKSNTINTQSNNKFDSVKEALKDNNISTIKEKEITPKESLKKSQSKPPLKKEEIKEIILDKKEKNKRIINDDDDDLKDDNDYIILGSGDEKNCLNNNKVCSTKFKILLNDEDFKENNNFKSDQFETKLNPNSNDEDKKVIFLFRILIEKNQF